jgi:hypothetical protein
VDTLSLIQSFYVLNQSHGHWLFNDVLTRKITLSLQLKEETVERIILDNDVVDDLGGYDTKFQPCYEYE